MEEEEKREEKKRRRQQQAGLNKKKMECIDVSTINTISVFFFLTLSNIGEFLYTSNLHGTLYLIVRDMVHCNCTNSCISI